MINEIQIEHTEFKDQIPPPPLQFLELSKILHWEDNVPSPPRSVRYLQYRRGLFSHLKIAVISDCNDGTHKGIFLYI